MNRRFWIGLSLIVGLMVSITFLAYQRGKNRYVFPVTFFSQGVPIPVAHHIYSGRGEWKEKNRLKVQFTPTPPDPDTQVLYCLGYLKTPGMVSYVLQGNQQILVEKATFIEPFLDAARLALIEYVTDNKIPDHVSPRIRQAMIWNDPHLLEDLQVWNKAVRTVDTNDFVPW